MLTTKSRAQGNSVVVTLPINGKEKPKVGETYLVFYEDDGSIILIPKIEDPFEDDLPTGVYYHDDEWSDMKPVGRELL